MQNRLSRDLAPGGSLDGQITRVLQRIALVAAAGRLATQMGLAGWPRDEALKAARAVARVRLVARGGVVPAEERDAIRRVGEFVTRHDESRFQRIDGQGLISDPKIRDRLGYRDEESFYVFGNVFRDEICAGVDPRLLAGVLVQRR